MVETTTAARIIVPAVDASPGTAEVRSILAAPARTSVLRDELLHFFLALDLSVAATTQPDLLLYARTAIDIQVSATLSTAPRASSPAATASSPTNLQSSSVTVPGGGVSSRPTNPSTVEAPYFRSDLSRSSSISVSSRPLSTSQPLQTNLQSLSPQSPPLQHDQGSAQMMANAGSTPTRGSRTKLNSVVTTAGSVHGSTESIALKPGDEEVVLCSYSYDPNVAKQAPLVSESNCLFPLRVPVDFKKLRALPSSEVEKVLNITVSFLQREDGKNSSAAFRSGFCDPDTFDTPNLLQGLSLDDSTSADSKAQQPALRRPASAKGTVSPRVVRVSLPVLSVFSVNSLFVSAGPEKRFLSVNVCNTTTYNVILYALGAERSSGASTYNSNKSVVLAHPAGVVGPTTTEPIRLGPDDRYSLIFIAPPKDVVPIAYRRSKNLSVDSSAVSPKASTASQYGLGDAEGSNDAVITFSASFSMESAGIGNQRIASRIGNITDPPLRVHKDIGSVATATGIGNSTVTRRDKSQVQIQFKVNRSTGVKNIFSVHFFLVNRSNDTKSVTFSSQSRSNEAASISGFSPSDREFVNAFAKADTRDSRVVCVERNLLSSRLEPQACQSVQLHFITFKDGEIAVQNLVSIDIN